MDRTKSRTRPRKGITDRGAALVAAATLLLASGCHKDDTSSNESTTAAEDAGSAANAVDPDLAKAVAAASAKAPLAAQGTKGGPPANGIFAPGQADKELAVDAPAKVALGVEGGAPRIDLSVVPKVGNKWAGKLDLSLQLDPQRPPIPLTLKLGAEVTRGKPVPSAVATPGEATSPSLMLAWKVTDAALGSGARLPPEASDAFGRLKGARVEFDLSPNGVATHPRWEAPKTAPPDIAEIVRALSDVLATLVLPRPDKPVGANAAWMVTTREPFMGLDLVTYRMAKVKTASSEEATLDLVIKRYAASTDFNTPLVKADTKLTLQQLQAPGNATMHFAKGALLPTQAQLRMQLAALLTLANAPGRTATVQSQTVARLELSPKK